MQSEALGVGVRVTAGVYRDAPVIRYNAHVLTSSASKFSIAVQTHRPAALRPDAIAFEHEKVVAMPALRMDAPPTVNASAVDEVAASRDGASG